MGANRRKRCLFEAVFRSGMTPAKLAPGVENADLRGALLTSQKASGGVGGRATQHESIGSD